MTTFYYSHDARQRHGTVSLSLYVEAYYWFCEELPKSLFIYDQDINGYELVFTTAKDARIAWIMLGEGCGDIEAPRLEICRPWVHWRSEKRKAFLKQEFEQYDSVYTALS